ncbi:uncharacterized protein LAESUDRAFT_713223 [Laetiporus sulphureus 93-53]|uniref:SET domain-containing protein n=1 Tax=Laetiporus sulphureus 93-53 TaxID=1314785 RepID=A0A165EWA1_9APHY|nr:uncharacterized protein LAESUDRAFT_713223 [Laetiporus sulphureus 93-53]KZT07901.1 hypothetical protein LAESUDRAFT_713223 [Laetiporus sulphureus 93-53]
MIAKSNSLELDALERTTERVQSVFDAVWNEFYSWEQEHSKLSIVSLACSPAFGRKRLFATPDVDLSLPLDRPATPDASAETTEDDTECLFTMYNIGDNGSFAVETLTIFESVDVGIVEPCNTYESCAPININILHGDDSSDMPFVPFADDSFFDARNHMLEYDTLAWQTNSKDPNQSARRLSLHFGISTAHIDETAVLPIRLGTYSSTPGAIWTGSQNDLAHWSDALKPFISSVARTLVPDARNLTTLLQEELTLFCPNLNCVQAHCLSHDFQQVTLSLHDNRFRNVSLHALADDPEAIACGRGCHLNFKGIEDVIPWSSVDVKNLRTFLHIFPGASECELAALCRKPCNEVATICKSPGMSTPFDDTDWELGTRSPELPFEFANIHVTITDPAIERTTVLASETVYAVREIAVATLTVSFVGLDAVAAGKVQNRKCASLVAARAVKLIANAIQSFAPRAIYNSEKNVCCNSRLQKGHVKASISTSQRCMQLDELTCYVQKVEVKRGSFGLEYVGELIYEPTFVTRSEVSYHRGRSYVYGLNASMNVDSAFVGNEARFINHSHQANCSVEILLVNGDHRIGIFAKRFISAGSELFLDYGPEFPL